MSSALTAEQLTLYNTLKDMGMDISLAKEAASMSLDAELAILFCTDEDVQHRERENHRAAVLLNQTSRGTRSSGARHAISSLREPLNNRSDRVQDLLGNKISWHGDGDGRHGYLLPVRWGGRRSNAC